MSEKDIWIQSALQFLNVPYLWGGYTPLEGLDCSGLAQELMRMLGLDPPEDQTAMDLMNHFMKEGASEIVDAGALAFYGTANRISHVGTLLGPSLMIEAAGGDSKTTTLAGALKSDARIRIRPYKYRRDLVRVLRPKGIPW